MACKSLGRGRDHDQPSPFWHCSFGASQTPEQLLELTQEHIRPLIPLIDRLNEAGAEDELKVISKVVVVNSALRRLYPVSCALGNGVLPWPRPRAFPARSLRRPPSEDGCRELLCGRRLATPIFRAERANQTYLGRLGELSRGNLHSQNSIQWVRNHCMTTLVSRLCEGQRATVLQLPAAARPEAAKERATPEVREPSLSS